jgi:chemotaxis-related protein WspB
VQAVIFHVGEECFAIDTASVTEVVPGIPARPVPASHDGLVGVIDYRGAVVPVLDLCRLFGRGPCPSRLGNRILVCSVGRKGRRWGEQAEAGEQLGILAEDVTQVRTLDTDAPGAHPGPEGIAGLGRILRDGERLVQLVEVEDLVPADVLRALVRRATKDAG